MINAKSKGYEVYLYCQKDSFLDVRAKIEKIHCVYLNWTPRSNISKLPNRQQIIKELANRKIDVVHSYEIRATLAIAAVLTNNHRVALMHTQASPLLRSFRKFWYRRRVHRIDRVFVSSPSLVDNVLGNLGVSLRKIYQSGQGIEVSSHYTENRHRLEMLLDSQHEEDFVIGSNIAIHDKNFDKVRSLINGIFCLNQESDKKFILLLILEGDWDSTLFAPALKRFVKEMGADEYIYFYSCYAKGSMVPDRVSSLQNLVNLWVSLKVRELIEDYTYSSLLCGVPVLVPRNDASMALLDEVGAVGESYKEGDVREIRDKCLKVLGNYKAYTEKLKKSHDKIADFLSMETYQDGVDKVYAQVVTGRRRLAARRNRRIGR
jgi:hypothetical protein